MRQENSLILSDTHAELILVVAEVNSLIPFALDKNQLIDWAADVLRLAPGVKPAKLAFLFDLFKTEQIVWDRNRGIQNIFAGLLRIGENEKGYYLKKRVW